MRNFLSQHIQALIASIHKLRKDPIANLMTISVIAIALALPTTFYVFLQNIKLIGHHWDESTQITLYLKNDLNEEQITVFLNQLHTWSQIAKTMYISAEQGLKEFETKTGFSEALKQLTHNPLPPVIVVTPSLTASTLPAIHALANHLKQLAPVDSVQLDMLWIQRLFAIVQFAKRIVWALGGLLAIAVLLMIGNSLRLSIKNSHHEIEIIKLVGGTPAFIRRPFLYMGVLFGFAGAILALIIVNSILLWLRESLVKLLALYHSDFYLSSLNLETSLFVLLSGIVLGILGSRLAVLFFFTTRTQSKIS